MVQPWLAVFLLSLVGCFTHGRGQAEVLSMIGPIEVEAAQKAWGDGILKIGEKLAESKEAARQEATSFVETLYGHGLLPVLVKPTISTTKPFRTTKAGVVSSLVGGDEEFPEDTGFAVGPARWDSIRFLNAGITIEGRQALAMGNYYFRDSFTGNETTLEYTFGYFRDSNGKLRINLHFSSTPYRNHSNSTQTSGISETEIKAAEKSFGDTIVQIGRYYQKGWSYKEHTLMMVETMFAYDMGPVLFKPAEVKDKPFRIDQAGAVSYFRGGDSNYPEDQGFALKPWAKFSFANKGLIMDEDVAWAMGQYTFEAEDGATAEAQYTFGYKKDSEGKLRITLFFASIPADGHVLEFGEVPKEKNLTEKNIEALQQSWCNDLVQVGNEYVMKGEYRKRAEELVDNSYAYAVRPVLFKPGEARLQPFRTSRAGAVSYFAGGDELFPEDWGFALRPWSAARFGNAAVLIHGTQGLTMGHIYYTDAQGVQRKGEYAMGFIRSVEGSIRINMHHATFPNYTEIRNFQRLHRSMATQAVTKLQVFEAQKIWADGIVKLGRLGREVLAIERENRLKNLVGAASEGKVNRTTLWTEAAAFVDKQYGFAEGPVLLKVTEATPTTRFRFSRAGAISWLIGSDPEFPADRGFALRPWNQVRFENKEVRIAENKAQALGSLLLVDDAGSERSLQFVMGYSCDLDGRLRIELSQMALPYGSSYRSMWDNVESAGGGVAGAIGNMAKGVHGAGSAAVGTVGSAFGAVRGGGVHLLIVLGLLGLGGAFVWYFGCAWGNHKVPGWGQQAAYGGAFGSYPSSNGWQQQQQSSYTGAYASGYQPTYSQSGGSRHQVSSYQPGYSQRYSAAPTGYMHSQYSARASDRDVQHLLSAS
eukprot:TRINITY_DN75741_c0_g1_i1.p1 TRINITY_DN75741_c0_g1~~TRINITY_DN75741_c0_g1_i1.p1  ORF type:complete len:873 (-),score=171.09 TRINITY_DN75741_c0_g1_i1:38-2656(-)